MLTIDLSSFEQSVLEIVRNALPQQKYVGFADVKQFLILSGVSENDFEKKVVVDPGFKKFVKRFEGSTKRYIKVAPAIDYIDKYLLKEIE